MSEELQRAVEITGIVIGAWVLVAALLAAGWMLLASRRSVASPVDVPVELMAPPEAFASFSASQAQSRADESTPSVEDPLSRERRAQTWDDVPGWVASDREWAVAVVLLGAPAVGDRTHAFVDFPSRTIDWRGLLLAASEWPADDRLLIYTAYDLASGSRDSKGAWSSSDHVTLQQMVDLDDSVANRLQAAVDVRRGRCDYLTAVVRAGGLG